MKSMPITICVFKRDLQFLITFCDFFEYLNLSKFKFAPNVCINTLGEMEND